MTKNNSQKLELLPIAGLPDIKPGDDLARMILDSIKENGLELLDGDILVITQKIISKAENRYVNITRIKPSRKAKRMARVSSKKPELIEAILRESRKVLRFNKRAIIVEHRNGFVCANAGLDRSNIYREGDEGTEWYLMLPEDADRSASLIRSSVENNQNVKVGVLIIDSHGRAWRYGTVGTSIGLAGLPGLVDLRGKADLYGRELKITRVGAADELAGAASLVMGQAAEKIPVVLARGFPYVLRDGSLKELLRDPEKDLFRK